MKTIGVLFVIIVAFLSSATIKSQKELLKGVWSFKDCSGDTCTLLPHSIENKPQIEFLESGDLYIDQFTGWCGTPPIQYTKVKGTWHKTSDSDIYIKYPHMGDTITANWKIISLSKESLVLRFEQQKKD